MKQYNSISIFIGVIVFILSVVACGDTHKDGKDVVDAPIPSTSISNGVGGPVFAAYLDIKEALVQTDGEGAQVAAQKIVSVLQADQDSLALEIRKDAEYISATSDPELQRTYFNTLSTNIYYLIKATSLNEDVVYMQYCPMAMDDGGAYWLSTEMKIFNPYFGDKMLHCGSVKEAIKSK